MQKAICCGEYSSLVYRQRDISSAWAIFITSAAFSFEKASLGSELK